MKGARPRIGHVIDSLGRSGGTEKNLTANLRLFDLDRMSHDVIALRPDSDSRLAEIPEEVNVTFLFEEDEPISRGQVLRRLLATDRLESYDVLHASLPLAGFGTRIAGMIRPVRVVESLVNISHESIRCVDNQAVTRTKLRLHTGLDWFTMKGVDAFHAVSQEVADSWARVVGIPPERITVIPRGVDVSSIPTRDQMTDDRRREIRSRVGVSPDAFLTVSVGRHEAQKGHRYVVEAVAEARHHVPNLEAVVVGREGNWTNRLHETIAGCGVEDIVRLAGSRSDVHEIMAAGDVFVFPSLYEGSGGNALLEAMAVGMPIITTGAAPMTDLVPDEEHGLLCARTDARCIAANIRRFADDTALGTALGRAAQQRARGFPDATEVARRFETLYATLVA